MQHRASARRYAGAAEGPPCFMPVARRHPMLKDLDPLLHADLLYVLAAMGHGDEVALVDRNFPAVSIGARVVRLDGILLPRALEAILSVMPLDDMRDTPV